MKPKVICIVFVLALVFSMAAALTSTGPANAAIFDIADGDVTGLINAINTANVNGESDTINLAAGGTYILNAVDNTTNGPNGLPSINSTITINGNGATIQRNSAEGTPNFRIFHVAGTGNVSMSSMTIRNGNTTSGGGGIYNDYNGEVTMTSCTISDNTAPSGRGGGIYNHGTMTMTGCTISGNSSSHDGGGINNDDDMTLTNCTVSDNEAGITGGSAEGGGIYNGDTLTLTNCTVSDNKTRGGGGGIYNHGTKTMTLRCTIVYGNTAGQPGDDIDNDGTIDDPTGESIVGDPDGDPDPLLGPLQNNGGTTETHALLTGSPAIDACIVSCNLTTDQRGQPRPVDGNLDYYAFCDVGAYEKQISVGGIVEPVDRIGILAPWLGLAAFIVVAMTAIVLFQRRRVA